MLKNVLFLYIIFDIHLYIYITKHLNLHMFCPKKGNKMWL